MADNTNTPKPEQIEALTRAEQILKDQLEKQLNIRFKSNEEFRKAIELNKEHLKQLNAIEIALDGQLDLYTEINRKVQDFGKGLQDNIRNAKLQGSTQLGLKGIYTALNNLQGKLISNQEDLLRGELSSNDVAKDLLKNRLLQQNQEKISRDIIDGQRSLFNSIQEKTRQISQSRGENKEKLKEEREELVGIYNTTNKIIVRLGESESAQADITKELENQLTTILEIEAKTGVAGKLLKGFSKIPVIGDMLDIQGAQKAMNVAAATGASGFKTMLTGVKALGPSLKAALGPLGLILMAVDAFKALIGVMFAADKQVTSIARNLSISKDEAADIRSSFNAIATASDLQYNRLEDIIDAQIQLSELSKFTILFSATALENQVALTKEIGLSESEAANLNKTFSLNNVEGSKGRKIVYDRIAAFANENKYIANGRKILQEVSKVSGQILLNFRGNLPALTNAVLQAEQLGVSLSDARNISNSLLDFESSISNELEAGVFLGRRFNLERARSLALQKDYVGATQEVLQQVGSIEEFQGMSAIHQQVIAKAANMTVDELSESLMYQQYLSDEQKQQYDRLKAAGREDIASKLASGKIKSEELEKAQRSLDAQEKFNIALDKAKEIFTSIVTGGTLDSLSVLLKNIVDSLAYFFGDEEKIAKIRVEAATNIVNDIQTQLESGNLSPEQQKSLLKRLKEQQEILKEELPNVKEDQKIQGMAATLSKAPSSEQLEAYYGGVETQKLADNLVSSLTKSIQSIPAKPPSQPVKDGYSDSSDGPFEITNKYGETAVTAIGDKLAASPNISVVDQPITPSINLSPIIKTTPPTLDLKPIIKTTSPTFNLTPMINAINEVRNAVATLTNKPTPQPTFVFQGNGAELGRFIGQYSELGTAQNINTAYLSS